MSLQLLPAKFVQHYILEERLNNLSAIVLGPTATSKVHSIKFEMGLSDVFFAGGWSQFLVFHDITEANTLLLRYEGNMVFTVKVFGLDGCQTESKHNEVRVPKGEQKINMFMLFFNLLAMNLNLSSLIKYQHY